MTLIENNVMEIVTVELISETTKNILICCVYRAPGSCGVTFTERRKNIYIYFILLKIRCRLYVRILTIIWIIWAVMEID